MDDIPIAPLPGKPASSAGTSGPGAPKSLPPEPRRDFLTKGAAIVAGGVITVCPVAAGLAVIADPLMRTGGEAKFVRVASLAALPDDGVPRQFPVIVESRDDAWTRFVNEPIGAVFLSRKPGTTEVTAWNATCPHAGCFVGFVAEKQQFFCPCHNSAFAIDGKVVSGPPPRDLDVLECQVEEGTGGILVKFQDFFVGVHEKKPKV